MLAVSFAAGSERGDRLLRWRPIAQWVCAVVGLAWEVAFAADLTRHSLAQGPPEVTVQPRTLFCAPAGEREKKVKTVKFLLIKNVNSCR